MAGASVRSFIRDSGGIYCQTHQSYIHSACFKTPKIKLEMMRNMNKNSCRLSVNDGFENSTFNTDHRFNIYQRFEHHTSSTSNCAIVPECSPLCNRTDVNHNYYVLQNLENARRVWIRETLELRVSSGFREALNANKQLPVPLPEGSDPKHQRITKFNYIGLPAVIPGAEDYTLTGPSSFSRSVKNFCTHYTN